MAPKMTRSETPTLRTAAASRTRRGEAATYETPIDVEAIGTAREAEHFTRQSDGTVRASGRGQASERGRARAYGGRRRQSRQRSRSGAGQGRGSRQQQQTGSTGEKVPSGTTQQSEEQQPGTGSAGQDTQENATQQNQQAGSTGQGNREQGEQESAQATSSGHVTEKNNAGATSLATGNGQGAAGSTDESHGQATNSTSGAASGSNGQVNGRRTSEKGGSDDTGQPNDGSKRRRSSSGSRQGSPKKPKPGEDTGKSGDANAEIQRQQPQGKESCARLQQLLTIYRGMPPPARNPTTPNTMMEDEDVYRAVVAVTEAISREGSHEYSFIDWTSFNSSTLTNREAMRQTVARPGNEILVPWINRSHHSLFYLQRRGDAGEFQAMHFDSARELGHRPTRNTQYNAIRQRLQQVNWTGEMAAGDARIPLESSNVDVVRQEGGTQCGLHVIFSAWALALGLRIARAMDRQRFRDFYRDGEILVQQAVQGNVSCEAIWAFFDCYEFIEAGQQINGSRSFENTVTIRDERDLATLTARTRIQEALPEGVDFDEAAADIAPGESDFRHLSTGEFLDRYNEHQRAIAAGLPTAGTGQAGGHSDDFDLEIQEALAQSLGQGGTNNQNEQAFGTAVQASGTAGETMTQSPGINTNSDMAAAQLSQLFEDRALDRGLCLHGAESSLNMQDRDSSWRDQVAPAGAPPMHANPTDPGDDSSSIQSCESSPQPTPPDSPRSEAQQHIPASTEVLNSIPPFWEPRREGHHAWTRERQQIRQEQLERQTRQQQAMQHVQNAQQSQAAAGLDSSYPPAPPPTASSLGPREIDTGTTTNEDDHNSDVQLQGESQPSTRFQTAGTEEQQVKSGDADDEERQQDDSMRRDSDEYEPPPADNPPEEHIDTPGMGSLTGDDGDPGDQDIEDLFSGDFYDD